MFHVFITEVDCNYWLKYFGLPGIYFENTILCFTKAQQCLSAAEDRDTAFRLSVPLSFCKGLFSVSAGTSRGGSTLTVSQKGAFGDMTAASELSYLINSFITGLFEKAVPSV